MILHAGMLREAGFCLARKFNTGRARGSQEKKGTGSTCGPEAYRDFILLPCLCTTRTERGGIRKPRNKTSRRRGKGRGLELIDPHQRSDAVLLANGEQMSLGAMNCKVEAKTARLSTTMIAVRSFPNRANLPTSDKGQIWPQQQHEPGHSTRPPFCPPFAIRLARPQILQKKRSKSRPEMRQAVPFAAFRAPGPSLMRRLQGGREEGG